MGEWTLPFSFTREPLGCTGINMFFRGQIVDAWGIRAIVKAVIGDTVLIHYPKNCGDEFLAGNDEFFPHELLSHYSFMDN